MMRPCRLFLPLFFAFALLMAQQGAAAHALGHVLEQQQDQHAPHSIGCDKCASYAQLGGAINSATRDFSLPHPGTDNEPSLAASFHFTAILSAAARAPPAHLHKIA